MTKKMKAAVAAVAVAFALLSTGGATGAVVDVKGPQMCC